MRRELRELPVWSLLLSQRNKKQDQGYLVPGNSPAGFSAPLDGAQSQGSQVLPAKVLMASTSHLDTTGDI